MYTIKEAAVRSGVAAPLIRAWERRYGVLQPVRTASGYRLYDDAAIRTLVAMRTLVASGWTASEAARAIAAGEVQVDAIVASAPAAAAGAPPDGGDRAAMIARFVRAAEATTPADTERVLDEMLAAGSFESVVDDLLLPAAAALGDAWADGRLSVAGEHAASAAVARRLAAAFQAAGAPGRVSVLVGLPPGSRHELGALAFAAALRRLDAGVLYLGADVPADAWLDAAARTHARAAVIGVVTADDRRAAVAVAQALLDQGLALVAAGGASAGVDAGPPDLPEAVVTMPPRVVDAAAEVVERLGQRKR